MAQTTQHSKPAPPLIARLSWLDLIKGLAILGIVWYHAALLIFGIPPFDHPKDEWLPLVDRLAQLRPLSHDSLPAALFLNVFRYLGWLGYQGAHLFIVISGFSLVWSQRHRSPKDNIDPRSFFQRRLWRIYPLYWAGHIFFLLFHAATGQPEISALDGRFYLSFAGVRFLPDLFFYISSSWWYIGLILQLYLVFPLLWRWLWRKGLVHFWVGTALLTLVSRYLFLIVVGRNREMWSMGALFITRLFEFTFGMGLAYLKIQRPDSIELLQRRWPLLVAGVTYVLGLVLSFTVVGSIVSHILIAVGLFTLAYNFTQLRLFAIKPLKYVVGWLGRQSYGVMILHQPVLWWFIPVAMPRVSYPLFFALLTAFSALIIVGSAVIGTAVDRAASWATHLGKMSKQAVRGGHGG